MARILADVPVSPDRWGEGRQGAYRVREALLVISSRSDKQARQL